MREPISAFGWNGSAMAAPAPALSPLPNGVVADKGSHVEAAYRGPSPDNPSMSLKKRLKRATFFDQRARQVAKGEAVPVAPGAGLPAAMAKQASRIAGAVKAHAPRPMSHQPALRPAWT